MEHQNSAMTAAALEQITGEQHPLSPFNCHILPGEEHVAVVVTRDDRHYVYYRCQMKWWEAVVVPQSPGGSGMIIRTTKVASALSGPAGAAKRLKKNGTAFTGR